MSQRDQQDSSISDMNRINFESNGRSFRSTPGNRLRSGSTYQGNGFSTSRRKKYSGPLGTIFALGPILFLPLLFLYLETIFHLYVGLNMKYFPIFAFFAISAGFLFSIFTIIFNKPINRIITYLITIIFGLLFCIEIVCKAVLSQFYQLLSSADTAADNSLWDYKDAIVEGIIDNLFGLILMLLPIVFIFTIGRSCFSFKRKKLPLTCAVAVVAIIFHIFGLLSLYFPWSGDLTPKDLYYTDTNVDDQVEQLGMLNMLRLDVKHTLFGVGSNLSDDDNDFSDLDDLFDNPSPSPSSDVPADNPAQSQNPGASDAPTPSPTPTVDTSPNVMDIDFESLVNNAKNDDIEWMHKYYSSVPPTNKNKYTGMFEGYNVIFITAEGFSKYLISEELTPTLYRLTHEGFVFNNYYTPLHFTSTSGGEWQNLTGQYPKNGMPISMKQSGISKTFLPFTLANQLNKLGYTSIGYHNNKEMYGRAKSHPNLGYDWKQGGEGFTMEQTSSGKNVWPQSDKYMIETTIDEYINSDKPFNIYYLTVSGHMPYNFSGDQMAVRNQEAVANLPYSDTTKAYIAANLELEKAMAYLVQRLEETGVADKTLLVMSPDHIPYFDVPVLEELAGKKMGGSGLENLKESDVDFDVYLNSLIMWSGSIKEPIIVDKICSQVDVLPTMSNLLGLNYDSRMLAGTDIFSDAPPLVIFTSSSWLSDKGLYNRYSGEFTPAEGVTMSAEEQEAYVTAMKKLVRYRLQSSTLIVEQNYYKSVFK